MAPLTVFLAKLIGLYCVLYGLAMALQKQAMVDIVRALMRNGPVLLIVEAIALVSQDRRFAAPIFIAGARPANPI